MSSLGDKFIGKVVEKLLERLSEKCKIRIAVDLKQHNGIVKGEIVIGLEELE